MTRMPCGEKENLHASLNRQRDVVLWKLDGLGDEEVRRPMTPSGLTLLGVVKHLGAVEYSWFRQCFGRSTEALPFAEHDEDAAFRVRPEDTAARVVAFYRRARAAADEVIGELDLETLGSAWSGRTVSLRWVLVHMIEETARHAGHLDILRELTDGATGEYP
ncbi:MAG TPA: DinB family protein [Amycolatopsis sp.]|nr:DinB family protein [Amycolatopsis sp.]